jgi:hypothetical protein
LKPSDGISSPVPWFAADVYGRQVQPVVEAVESLKTLATDGGNGHLQLIGQPNVGDKFALEGRFDRRAIRLNFDQVGKWIGLGNLAHVVISIGGFSVMFATI